ncbi:GxxExxY protein [Gracilimonas sp.]|uniref:GxxExxY protein n=1 Tax=Gracilimonas sp. TaxID=1974203 RepID=UPI0028719A79|nr:GxxExxY protein [Gracilimonas sp.]
MTENEISKIVLDLAIQVHRALGPGLLESAYQKCLAYELEQQGLHVETERGLPLVYKEV